MGTSRKLVLVSLAVAGLLVGAAAAQTFISNPKSTLVLQFARGCVITDPQGHEDTNVTVTIFDVLPIAGDNYTQGYEVANVANTTSTLSGITATDDNGAVTSSIVVGATLPVSLTPGMAEPFDVVLTVTKAAMNYSETTITVAASCS